MAETKIIASISAALAVTFLIIVFLTTHIVRRQRQRNDLENRIALLISDCKQTVLAATQPVLQTASGDLDTTSTAHSDEPVARSNTQSIQGGETGTIASSALPQDETAKLPSTTRTTRTCNSKRSSYYAARVDALTQTSSRSASADQSSKSLRIFERNCSIALQPSSSLNYVSLTSDERRHDIQTIDSTAHCSERSASNSEKPERALNSDKRNVALPAELMRIVAQFCDFETFKAIRLCSRDCTYYTNEDFKRRAIALSISFRDASITRLLKFCQGAPREMIERIQILRVDTDDFEIWFLCSGTRMALVTGFAKLINCTTLILVHKRIHIPPIFNDRHGMCHMMEAICESRMPLREIKTEWEESLVRPVAQPLLSLTFSHVTLFQNSLLTLGNLKSLDLCLTLHIRQDIDFFRRLLNTVPNLTHLGIHLVFWRSNAPKLDVVQLEQAHLADIFFRTIARQAFPQNLASLRLRTPAVDPHLMRWASVTAQTLRKLELNIITSHIFQFHRFISAWCDLRDRMINAEKVKVNLKCCTKSSGWLQTPICCEFDAFDIHVGYRRWEFFEYSRLIFEDMERTILA